MRNILKFYMLSLEKKGENYPREDTILGNTVAPIKSIRFSMHLCLIHFRNKQHKANNSLVFSDIK